MSVSIKEIAKLAGVSRGTVDRALNDRPGINPEMKARILEIADQFGYRSNKAGRMLGMRKKPLCLGIQMPSEGNDFFSDVHRGLEQAARELADFGLRLKILTMKGYSVERQVAQIHQLIAEGIHGLAFVPIDQPAVSELMFHLAEQNIPVITLNNDIARGPRLCYVGNDYTASGRIAAGLVGLLADGRPLRTLIMTGSVQVLGHNQRISGFSQILRHSYPQVKILDILENQDDDQLAYRLMKDALRTWPNLDALYLTAGGAAGACQAISEYQVSQQIKVVAFDQTRKTESFLRSGLITASIGQEPYQQGYQAVKLLFDFLLDGTRPPPRVLTSNQIIIREHLPDYPADTTGHEAKIKAVSRHELVEQADGS